jgi:hypothetical protein
MRVITCLLATMLVLLVVVSAFAAPKLKVENAKYDFGEVFQGEKVLHTFSFKNEGDETLEIDRVRSSCGCTAVLLSEKSLPPGGQGEVRANFDSTRFRGAVSKTIYLYNNDPERPIMQLHLKGTVLEVVAAEPHQVNFGTVTAGQSVETNVVLSNQGDKKLEIGKPRATATELLVKMAKADFDQGDKVTIELKFTPKQGQTRFSGYVIVPIDGVPKNELRIPVYATIR